MVIAWLTSLLTLKNGCTQHLLVHTIQRHGYKNIGGPLNLGMFVRYSNMNRFIWGFKLGKTPKYAHDTSFLKLWSCCHEAEHNWLAYNVVL